MDYLPSLDGRGWGRVKAHNCPLPSCPPTGALISDLFCEDRKDQAEQNKDIARGKKDQHELNDAGDEIFFPETTVKAGNEEKDRMLFLSVPFVPGRDITMQNVNPGCEVPVHE